LISACAGCQLYVKLLAHLMGNYSSAYATPTLRCCLPPTTEEVYVFAHTPALFVCLSVCKITEKRVHDLDEMLRVDRCRDMDELINF